MLYGTIFILQNKQLKQNRRTIVLDYVDLSRLQFAYTIIIHFLFVPLTLGLALLMAIMETVYVKTNNIIYKQMTHFWGVLFAINFAMGVTTIFTFIFLF